MSIEELVNRAYTSWTLDAGTKWSDHMRAALTEQAAVHAIELRAYEATVENLEQRIRELEAQRVPEGWRLVPEIATDRMVSVGMDEDHRLDACDAAILWTAMLAAAAPKEGE